MIGGVALEFKWITDELSPHALENGGYTVLSLRTLQRTLIKEAKLAGPHRKNLRNAAHGVLDLMAGTTPLAVIDVDLSDPSALFDLYGFLVVPAKQRRRNLLVQARQELLDLSPDAYAEPQAGYAWTLQRLRYLFYDSNHPRDSWTAWEPGQLASDAAKLDQYQRAAVSAGMGVTQIIAPAGSGKTLTLTTRVRELVARGIKADRILVTTFNAVTAKELKDKLIGVGVGGTSVHTFHALGRRILSEERLLRGEIGDIGYRKWRLLCVHAKKETGEWIEAADAKAAIEDLKLQRKSPDDIPTHGDDANKTLQVLFRLYEEELERQGRNDYADLIVKSLDRLEFSATVRNKWQARWDCVLVDEYQDIEPIQEQLIRILAAPQDCLFIVGDEDQCIYSWRRADPTRIVQLDQVYPALERHVLQVSYRCPRRVISASNALVKHNLNRFPKPIISNPAREDDGRVVVSGYPSHQAMCAGVLEPLSHDPDYCRTAILTRTRRLLKVAAVALHEAGIPFMTREGMLAPTPCERTVLAYTRLIAAVISAEAEDVERVFEIPPTGLPDGGESTIARALRAGGSFCSAVSTLQLEGWQAAKVAARAEFLDTLVRETSAGRVMNRLLKDAGLAAYYRDAEKMSAANMDALETLDQLAAEASACDSLGQFVMKFSDRLEFFESGGDDVGFEVDTIHGAKGREWENVILFACDEDQMPHARALSEAKGRSAKDVLEEERRLAYVAFTRAKKTLMIAHLLGSPSRFLYEAGLLERPRRPMQPQPKSGPHPAQKPKQKSQPAQKPRQNSQPAQKPKQKSQPAQKPRQNSQPPQKPQQRSPQGASPGARGVRTTNVGRVHSNKMSGRLCGVCGKAIPAEGLMARVSIGGFDGWAHVACASRR